MPQQSTEQATLQEVRRLLAERAQKKRELDAIDLAISVAVGMDIADRPQKATLSKTAFRALCRPSHERLPEKKRPAMDSGMV
jgi:hypothetical protein